MATCLICSGQALVPVFAYDAPDRYEAAVGVTAAGYARSWRRCGDCGFHQSFYSRDEAVLDRLYESGYRDQQAAWRSGTTEEVFRRVIALPPEQSETAERVAWLSAALAELDGAGALPKAGDGPRRMLDVGGATGVFAYVFQQRAGGTWAAHVADPAESGRFLADWGVIYRQAPYRAGLFDAPFDLITLVFALEHVRDPDAALRAAHADLAGGALYIEVPDAWAFERLPADDDIFNSCHLWMFDPHSLVRLLRRTGFEVTHLRRHRTRRGHYALCALGVARS